MKFSLAFGTFSIAFSSSVKNFIQRILYIYYEFINNEQGRISNFLNHLLSFAFLIRKVLTIFYRDYIRNAKSIKQTWLTCQYQRKPFKCHRLISCEGEIKVSRLRLVETEIYWVHNVLKCRYSLSIYSSDSPLDCCDEGAAAILSDSFRNRSLLIRIDRWYNYTKAQFNSLSHVLYQNPNSRLKKELKNKNNFIINKLNLFIAEFYFIGINLKHFYLKNYELYTL